jgi:hypothetical protein
MEGNLKRNETVSPMAGKPASQEMLVDVTRLEREYFERLPDIEDPNQLVSFGTSGHRGSSLRDSFNESHVLAITQAIARALAGLSGATTDRAVLSKSSAAARASSSARTSRGGAVSRAGCPARHPCARASLMLRFTNELCPQ